MTQLDSFETALLQSLHEHAAVAQHQAHLSEPTSIRPSRRRRFQRLAAGIAASAAAAAALVAVGLSGPEPAFAVSTSGDGDIVVTIHDLSDAAALEQALGDRGVDADVDYDPGRTCFKSPSDTGGSGDARAVAPPSEAGEPDVQGTLDPNHPAPENLPTEPPATLTSSGDDWTLRIPAESVLNDTHFTLTTDSSGELTVGWEFTSPTGIGGRVVLQHDCQVH
jgi:hypothetical protein